MFPCASPRGYRNPARQTQKPNHGRARAQTHYKARHIVIRPRKWITFCDWKGWIFRLWKINGGHFKRVITTFLTTHTKRVTNKYGTTQFNCPRNKTIFHGMGKKSIWCIFFSRHRWTYLRLSPFFFFFLVCIRILCVNWFSLSSNEMFKANSHWNMLLFSLSTRLTSISTHIRDSMRECEKENKQEIIIYSAGWRFVQYLVQTMNNNQLIGIRVNDWILMRNAGVHLRNKTLLSKLMQLIHSAEI